MIMFDYLTTKGVKHHKKWLYNMEAAPKTIFLLVKFGYRYHFNIFFSLNPFLRPIWPNSLPSFQGKVYKCKIWNQIFHINWMALKSYGMQFLFYACVSLVKAQIFTCSMPLWPCYWSLSKMVWHLKITQPAWKAWGCESCLTSLT